MKQIDSGGEWFRTCEATTLLHISRTSLLKHQSNGHLKHGEHWIKTGPYKTSPTLWNIKPIRETMAEWSAPVKTCEQVFT